MKKTIFISILFILPIQLYAVDSNPIEFTDPELEKRYHELTQELRCMQCQGQSLAGSNSGLAQDMRNKTGNMIIEGKTNQQITDFWVTRYGDVVLYNPPFELKTYVLWLGPLVLVLVGFIVLLYFIRRHAKTTATPPTLTEEERDKIKQVLGK
ncbi:MAG TPA: cytochrome c-type biogenesis protein CcmH [Thioploca sp.]|nr:MAG: cytochrome c-type biogenesis protein CcmH [Gammaproteobacteria bacterium]HDN27874.1 cytochrome c-type biogenesis protein CcmH [Thioploca sp.]